MEKRLIRKRLSQLTPEQQRILEFIYWGFDHSHPIEPCKSLKKLGLLSEIGKVRVGKINRKFITVPQWEIPKEVIVIWLKSNQ